MSALIVTPRLTLLPPAVELAAPVTDYFWRNRRVLARFDPPRAPGFYRVEEQRCWLARERQQWQDGAAWHCYICLNGRPDRVIGMAELYRRSPGAPVELGYKLDAEHTGRGLMTEAVTALVDYAFGPLGLTGVTALVQPQNLPSRRVLEKTGFAPAGEEWMDGCRHLRFCRQRGDTLC